MSDSDGSDPTEHRSSRRRPQTQHPHPVKCPRCQSSNTKFCYYNNYNKTQPRHFCKACKRYWTKGGTLRNVPIGGGRKNKRLRCPTGASTTVTDTMDSKDASDVAKDSFFKPIGSEKSDDNVESYTDIEELRCLVTSWDHFYGSFIGCTMQQLAQDDHSRLGFSKISTNPSSDIPISFIEMVENDHENSVVTATSMIMPSSQQWQIPITSNLLEMKNRNWSELDTMVLEDLINKPWEDPTFKT